uniref:Uncharacterized protein n=2 Tax=Oryza sativa subsp. japonica TaxID=39947 RepID=Q53PP3_ORYSJ|nr:hypothetical protein LOC_Os11g06430 [Oryza sativa Japonica Group]ABA91675.1 hypothetical protein LOC_Os11g06430 [Oryza sativa Japonica Group]
MTWRSGGQNPKRIKNGSLTNMGLPNHCGRGYRVPAEVTAVFILPYPVISPVTAVTAQLSALRFAVTDNGRRQWQTQEMAVEVEDGGGRAAGVEDSGGRAALQRRKTAATVQARDDGGRAADVGDSGGCASAPVKLWSKMHQRSLNLSGGFTYVHEFAKRTSRSLNLVYCIIPVQSRV